MATDGELVMQRRMGRLLWADGIEGVYVVATENERDGAVLVANTHDDDEYEITIKKVRG